MLELHIDNTILSDSVVPVSWCVDRETLLELAAYGYKEPAIVINAYPVRSNSDYAYEKEKEWRKVMPLKDLMTYLQLHWAGEVCIRAFIAPDFSEAKKTLLDKNDYGGYRRSIVDYNGSLRVQQGLMALATKSHQQIPTQRFAEQCFSKPLLISVPKNLFAKEPAAWEEAWVNHFFAGRALDQCEFRRRRLFAYTLQPILMLLNLFCRSLPILCGLMYGARNLTFRHLIHPMSSSLNAAGEAATGGSIFWRPYAKSWRRFLLLPFMPVIGLPLIGMVALMIHFHSTIYFLITLVAIILLTGCSFAIAQLLHWLTNQWRQQRELQQAWYLDEQEMDLLVCNGQPKALKLSALPKQHRLLKLRLAEIKSQVCKPFSR
jgi:hypothetical protein